LIQPVSKSGLGLHQPHLGVEFWQIKSQKFQGPLYEENWNEHDHQTTAFL